MRDISSDNGQTMPELRQRRWRVLVVGSVGVFAAALTASIVAVALPVIGPHLRLSYSEALWVQTSYILVVTVMASPIGRLADMYGPLRLYTIGAVLFGLFSVAAAFSPSGLFLIVARAFQGVGGGLLSTTSPAIVTNAFPAEERGRALGLNIMAATVGFTLGPPLGGLIVTPLGWRWIFLVNAPVVLGILIGGWDLLAAERRDRAAELKRIGVSEKSRRIDIPGAVLLGIMLATLFLPLSFSPLWGWANPGTIGLLAVAVISAVGFVYVEEHTQDPVIDLSLFRSNPVFAGANTASLLYFSSTYGLTVFTAVFLEVVQGRSAQQAGLILLIQPAIVTAFTPFTGRLSDRVGPHGVAAVGMLLVAAGMAGLAMVSPTASIWLIVAALSIVGFGMACFVPPNMSAAMGSVSRSTLGVASGVNATMRGCGQGLSIAVRGAIAASKLGPSGGRVILLGKNAGISSAQTFAAGYREAMLVAAGLAVAGALVSLIGKPKPLKQELYEAPLIPPL